MASKLSYTVAHVCKTGCNEMNEKISFFFRAEVLAIDVSGFPPG